MTVIYEPLRASDWPGSLTDDSDREFSRFTASWSSTIDLLEREVAMLTSGSWWPDLVIQVALPDGSIRRAGRGRLLSGARVPDHPGVIVSFDSDVGPLQFAVDRFRGSGYQGYLPGWQANVRAVALGLEALRRVDRYGIATSRQQYRGWAQLGTGIDPSAPAPLTVDEAVRVLADAAGWTNERTKADPVGAFRVAARIVHPDAGGSDAAFGLITRAREALGG